LTEKGGRPPLAEEKVCGKKKGERNPRRKSVSIRNHYRFWGGAGALDEKVGRKSENLKWEYKEQTTSLPEATYEGQS